MIMVDIIFMFQGKGHGHNFGHGKILLLLSPRLPMVINRSINRILFLGHGQDHGDCRDHGHFKSYNHVSTTSHDKSTIDVLITPNPFYFKAEYLTNVGSGCTLHN
jgi:hypothetical protein